MLRGRLTGRSLAIGLVGSLLLSPLAPWPVRAAERLEVVIDGITLPITVDELQGLAGAGAGKRSELTTWLRLLDQDSRSGLIRLLNAPVLTRRSLAQQLLRSWAAQPLIDALGDLIQVDSAKGTERISSERILSTMEKLLTEAPQVSTLDLLEALPAERLRVNLDALLLAAGRWKTQVERQQRLTSHLSRQPAEVLDPLASGVERSRPGPRRIRLSVPHRVEDLELQSWSAPRSDRRRPWILVMPGLGGDPDHFQWLARGLASAGWSVVLMEHPGSDSAAVQALLEGREPLAGAEALRQRMQDLQAVLLAQRRGTLDVPGDRVVLIGHSLGAFTALMATGRAPQPGLPQRCRQALDELPLTNLSLLLQCELAKEGALEARISVPELAAVVGLNSFGSLIWPPGLSRPASIPVLLMGGTLDLITPPLAEQLGMLASFGQHPFSRAVIVEGGSHFSAIRVEGQSSSGDGDDLFRLGEELVGVNPLAVQELLRRELIAFLEQLEGAAQATASHHYQEGSVRWHRFNSRDAAVLESALQ